MDLSRWDGIGMDNSEDARCLGHFKHVENATLRPSYLLKFSALFCSFKVVLLFGFPLFTRHLSEEDNE